MQLHSQHRCPTTPTGTHYQRSRRRSGFTLLEFVGALTLFLTSVVLIGGAATTSLTARGNLNRAGQLDQQIDALLEAAAGIPFAELADNTFDVPAACPDEPEGVGDQAQSCVQVMGRTVAVTWNVVLGGDSASVLGGPADAADTAIISAFGTNTDGITVTRTRTVVAPSAGWSSSEDVLRVRLRGDWASLESPVMLLNGADFSNIVAAGMPDGQGTVAMRAEAGNCSTASPCRIGLRTAELRGHTATHRLDPATVVGQSGEIVLVAGAVTDAIATVGLVGRADLMVDASSSGTARRITSAGEIPATNSICVWLNFTDGNVDFEEPFCNSDQSGRTIPIVDYVPDPTQPTVRLPLPVATPLTLAAEAKTSIAGGQCPVIAGHRWWTGTTWDTVGSTGMCSTWTWGTPNNIDIFGDGTSARTAVGATLELEGAEQIVGQLLWTGTGSYPAAPGPGEPVFSKPRDAVHCGMPTACTVQVPVLNHTVSTSGSAPVVAGVFSAAAPGPFVGWPLAAVTPEVTGGDFSFVIDDAENETITATATSVPAGLSVCDSSWVVCTPLTSGDTIATGAAAGTEVYVKSGLLPDLSGNPAIVVALVDSSGRSRTESISLIGAHKPLLVQTFPAYAPQGGESQQVWARAFTSQGLSSSTDVEFTMAGVGTLLPSTVTSSADGTATTVLQAGARPSGASNITASINSGAISSSLPLVVEARPGALTVDAGDAAQGESTTATVTAADVAGDPLQNWAIAVGTEYEGDPARGVWAFRGACMTGLTGACVTPVRVDAAGPVGTWTARAQTNGVEGSDTSVSTAAPARIRIERATVTQGSDVDVRVAVTDGLGDPVGAGVDVTLTGPAGLTMTPSTLATGADGSATFNVSASDGLVPGGKELNAAAGSAVGTATITVAGRPVSMLVAPTVVVVEGLEAETVTVTVLDAGSNPIEGIVVNAVVSGSKILVTSGVSTNAAGQVELLVQAQPGATVIDRTLTVSVGGIEDSVHQVQVAS